MRLFLFTHILYTHKCIISLYNKVNHECQHKGLKEIILPTNNLYMTSTSLTTTNVCMSFQHGYLTFIPDDHIKQILRKLFDNLQKGLSVEDTRQKRIDCIKQTFNNHDLRAKRYLKIMDNQNETSRHRYRNNSEHNTEQQRTITTHM